MPKPRLNFEQAQARGSDQINAGRFADRRAAPPTIGTIGASPKHLTAPEKRVWNELAQAIPTGVAGSSDRISVEIAARLLSQFRTNPTDMQSSRLSLLMSMLSRLGLDPQARTRLQVSQPAEPRHADPLSRYMSALTNDEVQ